MTITVQAKMYIKLGLSTTLYSSGSLKLISHGVDCSYVHAYLLTDYRRVCVMYAHATNGS